MRAAQWLFDSYANKSSLLAFVQAAVSLEILLGEHSMSDIVGVGALLSNRCAYLIGDSSQEREVIMRDFARIYDTRSKIVHRGKSRLSHADQDDLYRLRQLCERVILKEAKLVRADEEPSA